MRRKIKVKAIAKYRNDPRRYVVLEFRDLDGNRITTKMLRSTVSNRRKLFADLEDLGFILPTKTAELERLAKDFWPKI